MHFMFWSPSRSTVQELLQALTNGVATASLASTLAFGLLSSASAQTVPAAPAASAAMQPTVNSSASSNAALVSQFASDGAPTSASTSSVNPSSSRAVRDDGSPTDPVARFLADKGLLGSVALQVRDKAADMASDLVISAMDFLGVRYKSGGQSRDGGFDCSGFTRHVFERSIGMILPRRASEQANMPGLMQVSENELKPGDLVFFNTLRHTFSHVGIYVGDNKFIHSPRAGGQVRIEDMGQSYWQKRFDGARRVPRLSKQQAGTQTAAPRATLNAAADIAP